MWCMAKAARQTRQPRAFGSVVAQRDRGRSRGQDWRHDGGTTVTVHDMHQAGAPGNLCEPEKNGLTSELEPGVGCGWVWLGVTDSLRGQSANGLTSRRKKKAANAKRRAKPSQDLFVLMHEEQAAKKKSLAA